MQKTASNIPTLNLLQKVKFSVPSPQDEPTTINSQQHTRILSLFMKDESRRNL